MSGRKKIPPLPFNGLKVIIGPLDLSADNWRWNRPIPECFNLWIALEGKAEMKTMGHVYPIRPGTAFVFSPHQEVAGRSISEERFRNFACRFMPIGGGGDVLRDKAAKLMGVQASHLALTKELCRAAVQSTHFKDGLAAQQSAGLCYQILAQIWRDAHTPAVQDPDTAIMRLIERLREQPSQRLSLSQMAVETRLSIAQFSRRFQALSGESPMNFAIQQRIRHAKHYLRGSSLQISEIADALGYSDIYFFSRQFKRETGMSPSEYRQSPAVKSETEPNKPRDPQSDQQG